MVKSALFKHTGSNLSVLIRTVTNIKWIKIYFNDGVLFVTAAIAESSVGQVANPDYGKFTGKFFMKFLINTTYLIRGKLDHVEKEGCACLKDDRGFKTSPSLR